jgi:hypothetical protein
MTDQELDRALAAAFEVNPSPDFLARVRAAVAADAPRTRWHLSRALAVPGVALAAAAGVALIVGWLAAERPAIPQSPVVVSHTLPPASPPAAEARPASPGFAQSNVVPIVPRTNPPPQPPAAARFPEVLVSSDEVRAFGLFIARAQAAAIPAELPTDDVSSGAALAVPRIAITPVDIEPLPSVTRLEQGDRP